jgi:hypothetical protein
MLLPLSEAQFSKNSEYTCENAGSQLLQKDRKYQSIPRHIPEDLHRHIMEGHPYAFQQVGQ